MSKYEVKHSGRGTRPKRIGLFEYDSYVPNHHTFKTVQSRVTVWFNTDVEQGLFDDYLKMMKFRIKRMIRGWAPGQIFKDTSIVDIKASVLEKTSTHQYLKIDMVLFIEEGNEFNREVVAELTESLAYMVIEILNEFGDIEYVSNSNRKNPR